MMAALLFLFSTTFVTATIPRELIHWRIAQLEQNISQYDSQLAVMRSSFSVLQTAIADSPNEPLVITSDRTKAENDALSRLGHMVSKGASELEIKTLVNRIDSTRVGGLISGYLNRLQLRQLEYVQQILWTMDTVAKYEEILTKKSHSTLPVQLADALVEYRQLRSRIEYVGTHAWPGIYSAPAMSDVMSGTGAKKLILTQAMQYAIRGGSSQFDWAANFVHTRKTFTETVWTDIFLDAADEMGRKWSIPLLKKLQACETTWTTEGGGGGGVVV